MWSEYIIQLYLTVFSKGIHIIYSPFPEIEFFQRIF